MTSVKSIPSSYERALQWLSGGGLRFQRQIPQNQNLHRIRRLNLAKMELTVLSLSHSLTMFSVDDLLTVDRSSRKADQSG